MLLGINDFQLPIILGVNHKKENKKERNTFLRLSFGRPHLQQFCCPDIVING